MEHRNGILREGFNPTFLFTWKGIRTEDEKKYHCHEHFEICYVQSGTGRYRLDDQIYDVHEGDIVVLNAGTNHQALATPGKPTVEFFVGLTDFTLGDLAPNTFPLKDGYPIIHTSGDFKLKIARLCVSMEAEKEFCRVGRYYMMKNYAIQLLILLIREQEESKEIKPAGQYSFESVNRKYVVEKIIDYFEDHYEEKISLDQIASNMYLSPFYVSKIFKAETGDTPIHFLIEIRMEKAKELLEKNRQMSIQEAAAKVGYEDAYHFSKLFKKKFGVSPSVVRRQD